MIIEMAQAIMGQPMAQNLASTNVLNALEQRMEVLVEEMGDLQLEEVHDTWIAEAIWGDVWDE